MSTGMGFMWVWVQVDLKIPMGYPWNALMPVVNLYILKTALLTALTLRSPRQLPDPDRVNIGKNMQQIVWLIQIPDA